MEMKDFAIRGFLCRMDDKREKPNIECVVCRYGRGGDFSKLSDLKEVKCDVMKLYADIGTLLRESKQP